MLYLVMVPESQHSCEAVYKFTDKQADSVIKVWNAYLEGGEKCVYPVTGFSHKEMDRRRLEIIPDI